MKNLISAAAVLALASGASASVLYSTGFESPFVAGSLNGQQGWLADAGTIINNAANAHSGNQYANMTGTQIGTSAKWAWYGGASFTPGVSDGIVTMTCWAGIFDYAGTKTVTAGLDAYDTNISRIGAVYLVSDGSIGVIDGLAAGGQTAAGTVSIGVYHKLQMVANYSTQSIEFFVDGVSLYVGSFASTDFSDVDIRGTRSTTGSGGGTTNCRFDDYSIETSAVPAPGALALVGLGGLVASRRRRA